MRGIDVQHDAELVRITRLASQLLKAPFSLVLGQAQPGTPVVMGDQVVGSLCTTQARAFDKGQQLALKVLAFKAARRLTQLLANR